MTRGRLGIGLRPGRPVELRVRKSADAGVEIQALDARHATARTAHLSLGLDDARELLRALQAACDRADALAYRAYKEAKKDVRERAELERVLESLRGR